MLQSYVSEQPLHEDQDTGLDLRRYYTILKKRIFYLLVPFVLVLVAGILVTAVQRPIYSAEGKILISADAIPVDLVRPTVSSAASERIQVIQQRIMTRDNLLAIIKKYGLFGGQQKYMSSSQLVDLMRQRTQVRLIDINAAQPNATIAFTVGFEYELPAIAMNVANEFVTLILDEDARSRTNRAIETTKFLSREVSRLEGELNTTEGKLAELKRRALQYSLANSASDAGDGGIRDPRITQLTSLKSDLIQKTSVYSSEHPEVKALKLKIAALEKSVSQTAQSTKGADAPASAATSKTASDAADKSVVDATEKLAINALEEQRLTLTRSLDDASQKLRSARLGESLERDQQSERLEVLEQPSMPQRPVRPNKPKLLMLALVAAVAAGLGMLIAAEMFDRSIRTSNELLAIIDSHLLVSIPYIVTEGELIRRKRVRLLASGTLLIVLIMGAAMGLYLGLLPSDLSTMDAASWLDRLRTLSR
jgi:capsular polysaccharide biosynthesis protein